jgi:hypothetical protein
MKKWKRYQKEHGLWVERPTMNKKEKEPEAVKAIAGRAGAKAKASKEDAGSDAVAKQGQVQEVIKKAVDKVGESVKDLKDGNILPV